MSKTEFIEAIIKSDLNRAEQIVVFIWYILSHEKVSEVQLEDIISCLESAGLPKQNKGRLYLQLKKTRLVINGSVRGILRLSPRHEEQIDKLVQRLKITTRPRIIAGVLDPDLLKDRNYFTKIVEQINGCYQFHFYDGAAVLMRRLIEILIIEIYIQLRRQSDIQKNSTFLMLDDLIGHLEADKQITKSRNLIAYLRNMKKIGDNSAHNRTFIANAIVINDIKMEFAYSISELAHLANVHR